MTKGKMFRSAILAGIAIGIAGFGYLALGGIAGAVFFSFGLITVIRYKMKLYTGVVGFVQSWDEIPDTFLVLLGNIVGCLLVGLLARLSRWKDDWPTGRSVAEAWPSAADSSSRLPSISPARRNGCPCCWASRSSSSAASRTASRMLSTT